MCIECTKCWYDTTVYKTEDGDEPNTIKRYRRCLKKECGHRFVTIEEVVRDVRPWRGSRKGVNNAVAPNKDKE